MDKPVIALFPGAFKLATRAHFEVVQKAAKICNEVKVIISNQDRGGYNSFISEKVWKQYKKLLPENVTIKVAENNSPVTDIYKEIKNKDNSYLVIFGKGEQNRYNSINEQREKYSNVEILDIGNIEDISATRLREAIAKRDLKEIQKLIPEGIKVKDFLLNFQLHEIKINKPLSLIVGNRYLLDTSRGTGHISKRRGEYLGKFDNNYHFFQPGLGKLEIPNSEIRKRLVKDITPKEDLDEIKIDKPTIFPLKLKPYKNKIDHYIKYDNRTEIGERTARVLNYILHELLAGNWKIPGMNTSEGLTGPVLSSLYKQLENYIKEKHLNEIKINNPIKKTLNDFAPYIEKFSQTSESWNLMNSELQNLGYDLSMGITYLIQDKINKNNSYELFKDLEKISLKIVNEEKIPGGLAKGKSLQDIADKHKTTLKQIQSQLQKGIKVEMEHTTSKEVAREIAMDHLWENPKYYDKLASIEEIKINKPGFPNFPQDKPWIYIVKDKQDYERITNYLSKEGWRKSNSITIDSMLKSIEENPNHIMVLVKWRDNNVKDYMFSSSRNLVEDDIQYVLNPERIPIKEELAESKNLGDLYHFTTIEYAANILKTNNLKASYVPKKEHERDFQSFGRERGERLKQKEGEGAYYISLTRDKQLYKKSPKIAGSSIRFTVDGTKLSSNYKIVPFFYYKDELMGEKDRHRYNENEERIISNVDRNGLKDFKKYLIKTELILDVLEDNQSYINRAKQLKEFYPELITLYKEKPMSIEQYEQEIIPTIEPYRDEEFLEIVDKTLNEVFTPENHQSILDRAIEWGCNYLQIEKPQINFINDPNYVQQHSSFGGYQPSDKSIIVSVYNRNTADICRSMYHEMIHFKQDIEGRLNLEAGKDGDPYENEANAMAGKMMRKLGREMPEIFEIENIQEIKIDKPGINLPIIVKNKTELLSQLKKLVNAGYWDFSEPGVKSQNFDNLTNYVTEEDFPITIKQGEEEKQISFQFPIP